MKKKKTSPATIHFITIHGGTEKMPVANPIIITFFSTNLYEMVKKWKKKEIENRSQSLPILCNRRFEQQKSTPQNTLSVMSNMTFVCSSTHARVRYNVKAIIRMPVLLYSSVLLLFTSGRHGGKKTKVRFHRRRIFFFFYEKMNWVS